MVPEGLSRFLFSHFLSKGDRKVRTCPKCYKTYDNTWLICLKCGTKLIESDSPIRPAEKTEVKDEEINIDRENTEIRIGKYLLAKLGVISFVIGIGFFIAYTFQYIPLLLKIGIGYAAGAFLLLGGNALEKKPNYTWFGKGFIGGGWVLLYFITFAIYHIPQARIIQNQFVDLVLLAIIALLMLIHLLKYKSQTIVAMALTLCFLTVGISE